MISVAVRPKACQNFRGRRSRTERRFVRPPVTKRAGCPRGRWIPSGTRVRLASSDRAMDSMSEKGITARKYHPWRRTSRDRVIQCSVKRGETTKRRAYAAMITPISQTVSPGGDGLSATETARAAVRPATRRVRLMAWARPYAKESRLGTGLGQRSHRIRIRSPKSDVETDGFSPSNGRRPVIESCRSERELFIRSRPVLSSADENKNRTNGVHRLSRPHVANLFVGSP